MSLFDLDTVERPELAYSTFTYKNAEFLGDHLYEGHWDEVSNAASGLGAKILKDGSLYLGYLKEGKSHGNGLYISAQDKEVYAGEWLFDIRHGKGHSITEDGT